MRIVVTGTQGQVARSLAERHGGRSDLELIFLGRPQFDLAEPGTFVDEIIALNPDAVVSAAAYTSVDNAEDEQELARAVNAIAPAAIAAAACALSIPIIHLSTDYVFGGGAGPKTEQDPTNPQTVYGKTKLEGEKLVAKANPDHVILRTSWIYSPFGKNFVKTMLALAETREAVSVVDDQTGNPTSAFDIADGILRVLRHTVEEPDREQRYGTYNMCGAEAVTWCGFAKELFSCSVKRGGPAAEVNPIESAAFPTRAARPKDSRLDCTKFVAAFGSALPGFRDALARDMSQILGSARVK